MVGHVQAVGDPLEDLCLGEPSLAADDFADASLPDLDGSADPDLADPGELLEQLDQRAHVAFGKSASDAGVLPE